MDAKSFLTTKYDAAMEEMKKIEADYKVRRERIQAEIDMANKWMSELEPKTWVSTPVRSN